jgi:hypothetical protein
MKLKDKEVLEMFKKLGDCEVIAFDTKEIAENIKDAYDMRTYAHDLLVQADILLDEVLKELSGIKNNENKTTASKVKSNKITKRRKANKTSGQYSK